METPSPFALAAPSVKESVWIRLDHTMEKSREELEAQIRQELEEEERIYKEQWEEYRKTHPPPPLSWKDIKIGMANGLVLCCYPAIVLVIGVVGAFHSFNESIKSFLKSD